MHAHAEGAGCEQTVEPLLCLDVWANVLMKWRSVGKWVGGWDGRATHSRPSCLTENA